MSMIAASDHPMAGSRDWLNSFAGRSDGGPSRVAKGFDSDVENVPIGDDEVGDLILPEPAKIVVLLRCTVIWLTKPVVDQEHAKVEVASAQTGDKMRGWRRDHDAEFFEQLAGDGV
jgi:hypothetical protein